MNQLRLDGLVSTGSAVLSSDGVYRYRLEREVQPDGIVFAFFGVNPSTADAETEDQTTKKWRGFTARNGGRRYIAGNPFAFRAREVKALASAADPIGPENHRVLQGIIGEADVLVPCWGDENKVPPRLRYRFTALKQMLADSGKPVRVFGYTSAHYPKHPLMLGYDTPLVDWNEAW